MSRFKLTLEYDGGPYQGFQRQPIGPTVQGTLETALEKFQGQFIRVYAAGRTDTGVHATGQVCHVDLPRIYEPHAICSALNYFIKEEPVRVLAAEPVSDDFHARFSATGRRYLYRILNRPASSALEVSRIWHVPQALNIELMQEAASHLVGTHDFNTFRTVRCQAKSSIRTLEELTITAQGQEIHVVAGARSFLHHQVRNMLGTLVLVGRGHWTIDDMRIAFAKKDRTAGGPTAPAHGLYLTDVIYGNRPLS
jgi:tRNA pseudouridine38-40 synthase